MSRCVCYRTLIVALAMTTVAGIARAAYDPPVVTIGAAGHGKVAVTITAGGSGTPEGFTVRWMSETSYTAYGGWPSQPASDEGWGWFTGQPTLNTNGGIVTSFQLTPDQSVTIEVGDLFDETGLSGTYGAELGEGVRYVFTAYANSGVSTQSAYAATVRATTTTTDQRNCTYTQGYWKTHSNWPVDQLMLGTRMYSFEELKAILNEPARGNGLISLAHQLIAAKLNVANGADASLIASYITQADALIGSLVVPPTSGSSDFISPSQTESLTQKLDDYNNGLVGPPHCGTTPVRPAGWGQIKALYR